MNGPGNPWVTRALTVALAVVGVAAIVETVVAVQRWGLADGLPMIGIAILAALTAGRVFVGRERKP